MTTRDGADLPAGTTTERLEDPSGGPAATLFLCPPPVPAGKAPLLLVHSINAAAGAHEMLPLMAHYAGTRPVAAVDLPGFGRADRPAGRYTPQLMSNAVGRAAARLAEVAGTDRVDAMSLSLASELLARAALSEPDRFRSLAFISPTGLDGRGTEGPTNGNRGIAWFRRLLDLPGVGSGAFALLTRRPVVRYFLERTFGGPGVPERLVEQAVAETRVVGARHAPLDFLAGFLFSTDVLSLYDRLACPVWVAHGDRGDFSRYPVLDRYRDRWQVTALPTGAMPHFEMLEPMVAAWDTFSAAVGDGEPNAS